MRVPAACGRSRITEPKIIIILILLIPEERPSEYMPDTTRLIRSGKMGLRVWSQACAECDLKRVLCAIQRFGCVTPGTCACVTESHASDQDTDSRNRGKPWSRRPKALEFTDHLHPLHVTEPNRPSPSAASPAGCALARWEKNLHVKIRGLMIWDRFRSSMSFEPSKRFLRSGSLFWSGSSLVGNGSVKDFSPNLIKSPNQPATSHFVWRTDSRGLYKYENAQLLKQPLKQRDHLKTK